VSVGIWPPHSSAAVSVFRVSSESSCPKFIAERSGKGGGSLSLLFKLLNAAAHEEIAPSSVRVRHIFIIFLLIDDDCPKLLLSSPYFNDDT
jgi:hypothetical protein